MLFEPLQLGALSHSLGAEVYQVPPGIGMSGCYIESFRLTLNPSHLGIKKCVQVSHFSGPPSSTNRTGTQASGAGPGFCCHSVSFCLPASCVPGCPQSSPEPAGHGTSNISSCWHGGHFTIWARGLESRWFPYLIISVVNLTQT